MGSGDNFDASMTFVHERGDIEFYYYRFAVCSETDLNNTNGRLQFIVSKCYGYQNESIKCVHF